MSVLDELLKEAGVEAREPTDEEVRIARYSINAFVAKALYELQIDDNWKDIPEDAQKTLSSFADTIIELSRTAPDETVRKLVKSTLKLIAYEDAKTGGEPISGVLEVGFGAGFGKDED